MKKLSLVIASAFLLAGTANAQDTINLTSAQMDRVTAGVFAGAFAASGGGFSAEGFSDIIASSEGGTFTETNASEEDGTASAFAASTNTTQVLIDGGYSEVGSGSFSAVIITDSPPAP